ncbi:hypothetical protein ILYODFUR_030396 [Ilyodon furcidens]|uniref:Uncharacterized protein n=1 Tax=Ilyodon furcidens TaxID=33524 RepID=A0ABV0T2Y6_9TELE
MLDTGCALTFPPLDAAGARGNPKGDRSSSFLYQPVHHKREDCQYLSGVASCSRLPSSQGIQKTTTDRDYYLNLCSAGSLQRLGALLYTLPLPGGYLTPDKVYPAQEQRRQRWAESYGIYQVDLLSALLRSGPGNTGMSATGSADSEE